MTLGLSEGRNRRQRRRRSWWTTIRWLIVFAIVGGAGTYSYNLGGELALQEVRVLEARLGELSGENGRLQSRLDGAGKVIREATARVSRLEGEVPNEREQQLLSTIRERLSGGVDPDRLAFVLGAVSNTPECFGEPKTRRFIVGTELSGGGNDTVSFSEESVLVTASGEMSRSDADELQAWFDPAQPIVARFRNIDGTETVATGVLPLTHSVVIGDVEHRFALKSGARAFVEVTSHACRYP